MQNPPPQHLALPFTLENLGLIADNFLRGKVGDGEKEFAQDLLRQYLHFCEKEQVNGEGQAKQADMCLTPGPSPPSDDFQRGAGGFFGEQGVPMVRSISSVVRIRTNSSSVSASVLANEENETTLPPREVGSFSFFGKMRARSCSGKSEEETTLLSISSVGKLLKERRGSGIRKSVSKKIIPGLDLDKDGGAGRANLGFMFAPEACLYIDNLNIDLEFENEKVSTRLRRRHNYNAAHIYCLFQLVASLLGSLRSLLLALNIILKLTCRFTTR